MNNADLADGEMERLREAARTNTAALICLLTRERDEARAEALAFRQRVEVFTLERTALEDHAKAIIVALEAEVARLKEALSETRCYGDER